MTKSEKACRAIRKATSESEVIGAVRKYLDSLDTSDAALLPAEILVIGLAPAEELIQSALQTLDTHMKARKSKSGILPETILVLTTAARRLAALAQDRS